MHGAGCLFWLASTIGCAPIPPDDRIELRVTVEPDGDVSAAPRVLRLRLEGGDWDPTDCHLVRGELSPTHLRQLAEGDPSSTLEERIVTGTSWRSDGAVYLAPSVLEPGESYTLAVASTGDTQSVTVAEDDPIPLLERVWPPEEVVGGASRAVWCGQDPLPPVDVATTLEPGSVLTRIQSGAHPLGMGRSCVRMTVPAGGELRVAPAAVLAGPGVPIARLAPTVFSVGEVHVPVASEVCPIGEIPIGAGCIERVEDDRIRVRPPEGSVLWALGSGPLLDVVRTSEMRRSFSVRPLVPGAPIDITWAMVDLAGQDHAGVLRVFTRAPMAHLVITESHNNPVGEEPDQEFVELYNDGLAAADLGDFVLEDIGGETPLPHGVVLAPGAYALIVNETFDAASEYDPVPVEGTLIVRVDKLGKGGLKNDGEPLRLLRRGEVVSRFPPQPKPKSGESVQRIHPMVQVDEEAGFVRSLSTPGAPFTESMEGTP